MLKNLLIMVSMLILFYGQAFAAHPLITDDTGAQGKNSLQIEINFEYSSDKEKTSEKTGSEEVIGLVYGITNNTDIVIGLPYQWIKITDDGITVSDEKGISDISFELKHAFHEKDGLSFAIKPGVSFPTGDNEKGLGSGKAAYSLFFITTKEIESWAFHLNIGYARNENKADEELNIWHTSLASEAEIIKNLKFVSNIGIEKNTDKTSEINPAFILGGLIYSVKENLDIDFGAKFGLNSVETDNTILAGITLKY